MKRGVPIDDIACQSAVFLSFFFVLLTKYAQCVIILSEKMRNIAKRGEKWRKE